MIRLALMHSVTFALSLHFCCLLTTKSSACFAAVRFVSYIFDHMGRVYVGMESENGAWLMSGLFWACYQHINGNWWHLAEVKLVIVELR